MFNKIPPLLILLVSFFLGIVIERILHWPPQIIFLLIILAAGFLVWQIKVHKHVYLALALTFLFFGMLRLSFVVVLPPHNVSFLDDGEKATFIGKIVSRPALSSYGNTGFLLEAKRRLAEDRLIKQSGKLKVSCKGELKGFAVGDLVKLEGFVTSFEEKTNPVGFPLKEYNFSHGIYQKLFIKPRDAELLKKGKPPFLENLIYALQKQIKARLSQFMPGYKDLLGSMLLGSKVAGLDREIKDKYKRAGVAHLLVASGMHLGIIVGSFATFLASLKIEPKRSFWILTALNLFYFLLAGAGTSISRASIMLELALISKLLGRDRDFFVSICFAAFLVLLRSPLDLFSAAFQLSFGATVGVVCVTPLLAGHLFKGLPLPSWLTQLFAIALAPLLLTYPICVYNFNQISLVAFFTNLVVLPLIAGLVIFASLTLIISFLIPILAKILGLGVYFGIFLLDSYVSLMSGMSFACMNVAKINILAVLVLYLLMYLGFRLLVKQGRRALMKFLVAISVSFFVFSGFTANSQLEIIVLDVDQGDAILISTPDKKNILIDAGDAGYGKKVILPVLQRRGVNKIDLMILTHPHMDHVGGMPEVIRGIKVNAFYDPALKHTAWAYREVLKLVKQEKIAYQVAKRGDHFSCGEVDFYILGPPTPRLNAESYLNDNSVILKVVYRDFSMILTGDAEHEGEKAALEYAAAVRMDLKSDVLKAGHHGSATASTKEFLQAVKPAYAVISCGKRNKFRHPHQAALDNLSEIGAKIYRTDINGAIIIKSDGIKYKISKIKGSKSEIF